MTLDYAQVLTDLRDETAELTSVLSGLQPTDWRRATPAAGWSVLDQVNHLAYFDDAASMAITDPAAFGAAAAKVAAGPADFPDVLVSSQRHMTHTESLRWFQKARATFIDLAAQHAPSARLPWYGVTMSMSSSVTARIMETWAHGQDIADASDIQRMPTMRLRHICHLGVATRGFSYRLRGRDAPDTDICLRLTAPDGATWSWGPDSAEQTVTGPALDFCLVVTQRRHLDDTELVVTGDDAREWLEMAQAFAGVRGNGRPRAADARPGATKPNNAGDVGNDE